MRNAAGSSGVASKLSMGPAIALRRRVLVGQVDQLGGVLVQSVLLDRFRQRPQSLHEQVEAVEGLVNLVGLRQGGRRALDRLQLVDELPQRDQKIVDRLIEAVPLRRAPPGRRVPTHVVAGPENKIVLQPDQFQVAAGSFVLAEPVELLLAWPWRGTVAGRRPNGR